VKARIVPHYLDLIGPLAEERVGRTVALTNGCFDLLHVGHIRLIREAAMLADLLVVAINDDASTRANKGPERPIIPFDQRVEVVAAVEGVAFVTGFGEPTPVELIAALRPEVHVKGTDWTPETVPERATVVRHGGRVAIAGDPKRRSSSDLIARIRGR
jgi:rfaE bifunctional protein nucleotidyltransferase chain/domain